MKKDQLVSCRKAISAVALLSATAYWYQDKALVLSFSLPSKDKWVNWHRIRDTDHQLIP